MNKRAINAYGGISILSAFLRQYYLPNPFEKYFTEAVYGMEPDVVALLANVIFGTLFLHTAAYSMTGCIYERSSNPPLGSVLYLLFYILNVGLMFVICYMGSIFNFSFKFLMVLFVIISICICSLIQLLHERITMY